MADQVGLEPTTSALTVPRNYQLCYWSMLLVGDADITFEQVYIAVDASLLEQLVLYADIGILVVQKVIVCSITHACQNQQDGYVLDILHNARHHVQYLWQEFK